MMPARTNRLGGLLDRFFIARGWSLHQASKLLGQHHTVLSAVIRGREAMSRKNLAKIIGRLAKGRGLDMTPDEAGDFAVDLQIAWLEDLALPDVGERIAVVRRRQRTAPVVTDPRTLALEALDAASSASPALAQWVVASAALLAHFPAYGQKYRRQSNPPPPPSKRQR